MGNDLLCILLAEAAVKNNRPLGASEVKALLRHIDSLQAKLDRIEEDKNDE